jgi:iron complex transport system substrate-binding protein
MRRIIATVVVALALAGCGAAPQSPAAGSSSSAPIDACTRPLAALAAAAPTYPATVPGLTGTRATVASGSRIVTTALGAGEIVYALGAGSRLVARDLASEFPGSADVPIANPGHQISLESVLALKPDLVIGSDAPEDAQVLMSLRKAGVAVAVIPDATGVSSIAERITATATALGIPQQGVELNRDVAARMEAPASPTGVRIAFLYVRGNAGVYLLGGKGSGADDLIARIGGTDVGTTLGVTGFAPLTAEQLAKANPQVILAMTKGVESVGGVDKLLAMPGVSGTQAALRHAVITEADDRLLSFGPSTPDVIACLAQQLAGVA